MSEVVEKKKPGRPRKNKVEVPIINKGVSEVPHDPTHLIEMVYYNYKIYKKLFGLFKSYDCLEITISFTKKQVVFSSTGPTCTVRATFNVDKLNFYYCEESHTVTVHRGELDNIFGSADKTDKITIIVDKINKDNIVTIIVYEEQHKCANRWDVDLINSTIEMVPFDKYELYPISYKVTADHFKKNISLIAKSSNMLLLQKKMKSDILTLTYPKTDRKPKFSSTYEDSKAIDFKFEDEQIFVISAKMDYIKPLANLSLGEDVIVYLQNGCNIVLQTLVDKIEKDHTCIIDVSIPFYKSNNFQ